jgi:hypothetical protein
MAMAMAMAMATSVERLATETATATAMVTATERKSSSLLKTVRLPMAPTKRFSIHAQAHSEKAWATGWRTGPISASTARV